MKIIRYAFLFLVICIPTYFLLGLNAVRLNAVEHERIKYNNALDGAVRDALNNLVEYDNGNKKYVNKDFAVSNFFNSLYCRMGITNNPTYQELMKLYIPVLLVTDDDGFYIYHNMNSNDNSHTFQSWTEKIPYSYLMNDYVINFTFGAYISILNITDHSVAEGDYHDLALFYQDIDFLSDPGKFDSIRRDTIIRSISSSMEYYVNKHNRIAKNYGIQYHFYLPVISNDDWNRTIDNPSMMILFQGYPYLSTNNTYFNRMEVGAARIKKANKYYISKLNGIMYYHTSDCPQIDSYTVPYNTTLECAKKGAFPCPNCSP